MQTIASASLLSKSKPVFLIGCYVGLAAVTLSPCFYRENAGTCSTILVGHQHRVRAIAFSPDGKTLASAAGERGRLSEVFFWDTATRTKLANLPPTPDLIACLAYTPDGRALALAGYDSRVTLWDTVAGRARWTNQGDSPVTSLAVSANGSTVAFGSMMDEGVHVLDASSGRECCRLPGMAPVALSPDGRTMAARNDRYHVQLWDLWTPTAWRASPECTDLVLAMAFSPDGRMLATAGFDRVISLWDRETGSLLGTLEGHGGTVHCLAFSANGKILATGSEDQSIKLWDLAAGCERRTLVGHGGAVSGIAFSPDATMLATCSFDRTVRLWDVSSEL